MSRAWLAVLAILAAPGAASACTWCVSTAFGDRTFNWPYLSLILAPFLVGLTVAGVLVHHTVGFSELCHRLLGARTLRHPRSAPGSPGREAPGGLGGPSRPPIE